MNHDIPKILKNYLEYLSTIQERSSSTVEGYKLDLIMMFNFLKNEKKISDDEKNNIKGKNNSNYENNNNANNNEKNNIKNEINKDNSDDYNNANNNDANYDKGNNLSENNAIHKSSGDIKINYYMENKISIVNNTDDNNVTKKISSDIKNNAHVDISDIDEEFIRNIKLEDLYSFMAFTKNAKNNNAFTRARKVASIKSFFKYCQSKIKILDENISLDLETPKLPKKQVAYLSLEESKKLLKSITGRNKERDFCIITLLLNCGLRLNELCNIKLEDIRDDILVVRGKGNKDRTIYLNESCIVAIKEYLSIRNNVNNTYLFISERGRQICKRSVQIIVKNNIIAAGLDPEKYSTHKLRHTSATLLYKYGKVDIRSLQKILGHENIMTTTIYTHVDDEDIRKAIRSNPLNN